VWGYSNKEKSTIPGHFLGIFEISRGRKGMPNNQSKFVYLFKILSSHQSRPLLFEGALSIFLYLGDNQFWKKCKSAKSSFQIYIEFD